LDVRCDPRARWTEDLYEDLPPGDRILIINNSYGARQPYGRFAHCYPRVASYVNFDTVKIIRTIGVDEASDMGDKFLPRELATYPCVRAILIAMQLMRSCPYDVNLG
jgi:hypothetical protein